VNVDGEIAISPSRWCEALSLVLHNAISGDEGASTIK
jgi:hypothetical protein